MTEKWYERLNEYFPKHEMKDIRQITDLIEDKDVYHKEENEDYIILYAEFPSFVFIDYLLVNPNTRGKGLGTKLLNKFKDKGKTIILEVEPTDPADEDTAKRNAFYEKNGFIHADRIEYERESEEGESYTMNILYWDPDHLPQEAVLEKMAKACREIHNFRSKRYYGRLVADPEEVLELKETHDGGQTPLVR
jgi:GNAT superfamily N-acetyltransferase